MLFDQIILYNNNNEYLFLPYIPCIRLLIQTIRDTNLLGVVKCNFEYGIEIRLFRI